MPTTGTHNTMTCFVSYITTQSKQCTSTLFVSYSIQEAKKISPKSKKDLHVGMACHVPLHKKAKKQREMPVPCLGPFH